MDKITQTQLDLFEKLDDTEESELSFEEEGRTYEEDEK